jgi:ABC-type phosphate transport system substrate-binding protein
VAIYGAVVGALLVFRIVPEIRSRISGVGFPAGGSATLTVSGQDVAPELISSAVAEYQGLYPDMDLRVRPGGTLHAVDDLLNRRADVVFMNRELTKAEERIVHAAGDSMLAYAVALGAIMVVVSSRAPLDSLPVGELREILAGNPGAPSSGGEPYRVYAPEPNLGLWGAVATQLGLPEVPGDGVFWLASEAEVLSAVAADPVGLGLVSTFTFPHARDGPGWRAIRIGREPGDSTGALPVAGPIETGTYPLYHYLYAGCLSSVNELGAGFVTFFHSGRGQRWIRREGYLPAREVLHEVQLVQLPIGGQE